MNDRAQLVGFNADPAPPKVSRKGIGTALVALVGGPAAVLLFTNVPAEESGRQVDASLQADGSVQVEHRAGAEHRTAYRDIVGVLTICDGDTKGVRAGMVETREGCTRRLEQQLIAHAEPVMACVPTLREPGRDYQRAAAVSLAFNIGVSGFCRSTAAKRFRVRDWRGGCDAFLVWNRAGGKVVRGLTLRRQRERAICLRGL